MIARKGYHGATTTDIADKLGVAQPSLYYYLASKDEALEEICRIGTAGYLERLQAIMDGAVITPNKIRDAILAHIELVLTIPNYAKSSQRERRYLPDGRRRELGRLTGEYYTLFRLLLDCGLAALMLITQCNAAQYFVTDEVSLARTSASIADVFLAGAER